MVFTLNKMSPITKSGIDEQQTAIVKVESGKVITVNKVDYLIVRGLSRNKLSLRKIYAAKRVSDNAFFAIKVETLTNNSVSVLNVELNNYKKIYGTEDFEEREVQGFITLFGFEAQPTANILVMKLLGPNLEEVFNLVNRNFSLKTMIYITLQLITIFEKLHQQKLVFRNVAPENILISPRASSNSLYLSDMSYAKCFLTKTGERRLCETSGNTPKGCPRYMSRKAMACMEQFERDDLESLCYMLIYFLRQGSLPWMGFGGTQEEKFQKILQIKLSTTPESLTLGFPTEYWQLLHEVENMESITIPNYKLMLEWFLNLFKRERFVDDGVYDWTKFIETREKRRKVSSLNL